MPSVLSRLSAAADGNAAITLRRLRRGHLRRLRCGATPGPDAVDRVTWRQLHDDARAMAVGAPGARRRPGHPRRHARADDPAARHRDPGHVARRRHRGALPLPMRLGSIEEFVDADARAHRATPTPRSCSSTPTSRRSSPPSPATRPMVLRSTSSTPRGTPTPRALRAARRRSRLASRSCSSRAARPPSPKGVMLPHRCVIANIDAIVEAAGLGPTDDAPSRGCRCTTTWGSSGC